MTNTTTNDIVMLDVVMLDTNVLFRQEITNILLNLHEQEVISIHWTLDIQNEWIKNKIKQQTRAKEKGTPKTKQELENKINNITKKNSDILISEYENIIPKMTNEKKDRHVLAAAVAGKCNAILTYNKKDFKIESTSPYGIITQTPDEFLMKFTNKNHEHFPNFIHAIKTQHSYLTNPPISFDEYLNLLDGDGQGIPNIVKTLRK